MADLLNILGKRVLRRIFVQKIRDEKDVPYLGLREAGSGGGGYSDALMILH